MKLAVTVFILSLFICGNADAQCSVRPDGYMQYRDVPIRQPWGISCGAFPVQQFAGRQVLQCVRTSRTLYQGVVRVDFKDQLSLYISSDVPELRHFCGANFALEEGAPSPEEFRKNRPVPKPAWTDTPGRGNSVNRYSWSASCMSNTYRSEYDCKAVELTIPEPFELCDFSVSIIKRTNDLQRYKARGLPDRSAIELVFHVRGNHNHLDQHRGEIHVSVEARLTYKFGPRNGTPAPNIMSRANSCTGQEVGGERCACENRGRKQFVMVCRRQIDGVDQIVSEQRSENCEF